MRHTSAAILVCLSLLPAALAQNNTLLVHFIDVGQADATLLEFPCGAMLIDTGAQDSAHQDQLTHFLDDFFQRRGDLNNTLKSVIITHNHIDHTRALRDVVSGFTVERFIDNGQNRGTGTGNPNWVRREEGAGSTLQSKKSLGRRSVPFRTERA